MKPFGISDICLRVNTTKQTNLNQSSERFETGQAEILENLEGTKHTCTVQVLRTLHFDTRRHGQTPVSTLKKSAANGVYAKIVWLSH